MHILQPILGLFVFTGICMLFSTRRKAIRWRTVGGAIALQFILALLILRAPYVEGAFAVIAEGFVRVIGYTDYGSEFLFGSFVMGGEMAPELINFAFRILPTIVFFSAFSALLHHLGILGLFIKGFAWLMHRTLKLSGTESLSAASNVFLGQTESPLLIRPYLDKMTKSELMCVMTGGMATIAGSVFAAFVGFLGGDDPVQQAYFATHLLTASIISAPAAIATSKLLVPEVDKKESEIENVKLEKSTATNVLEALSTGTRDGLMLAANVGVMLLVFTALVYFFNDILGWMGGWTGLNDAISNVPGSRFDSLSLQYILGYVGAPLAWLTGVASSDVLLVGQLLGEKTVINEFYAYVTMGGMKSDGLFHSERSVLIATYVLCGFANFASIGIQVGGIGVLAPSRRKDLARLGFRALLGGTVACLFTACVVSLIAP
ncbi:MAG: nucleoside transporter C-terminal domain-containing protein [Flavobacteriales bacterium]|nr:nucleoside transporter C-terminal domain-containing protein [Flavobacteriales bacterium]